MSESKIQNKIKQALERMGWDVVKVIQLSKNGYPDLMCLKNGVTFWIEVKDKGKKPEPLQYYRIEELKNNGFHAIWSDNLTFVTDYMRLQNLI